MEQFVDEIRISSLTIYSESPSLYGEFEWVKLEMGSNVR